MPNHRQKVHFRYNNKFKSDQSYTTRWETRSAETETGRLVLLLLPGSGNTGNRILCGAQTLHQVTVKCATITPLHPDRGSHILV